MSGVDLSKISDDELRAIASGQNKKPQADISQMSVEELTKIANPPSPQREISPIETAATSAVKGATMGYMPQIAGGLAALIPGGDDYTSMRDKTADYYKESERQNPKSAFASELAGGALLPGGAALKGAKTIGQAMRGGAVIGGLSGLLTNPGDEKGKIDPLQLESRVGGGLAGLVAGSALAGGGKFIGNQVATSRLAQELRENPDLVQNKLKDVIKTTVNKVKEKVISPEEDVINFYTKGKTAKLNPDIIPSGTTSPITGREVLGATKEKLKQQAIKVTQEPGSNLDIPRIVTNESPTVQFGSNIQREVPQGRLANPEDLRQSINVAPDQLQMPLQQRLANDAGVLNPMGRPVNTGPTVHVQEPLPLNAPPIQENLGPQRIVGANQSVQEPLPLREMVAKRTVDPYVDVPLEDVRRMMKVGGKLSDFSDSPDATDAYKAAAPKWENFRNIARQKLVDSAPEIDTALKNQAAAYRAIGAVDRFGKAPISGFGRKEGSDPSAAFRAVDRLLEESGDTGGLMAYLQSVNSANKYNRPIEGTLGSVVSSAINLAGRKVPATVGRALLVDNEIASSAYKKLLPALIAERARALGKK